MTTPQLKSQKPQASFSVHFASSDDVGSKSQCATSNRIVLTADREKNTGYFPATALSTDEKQGQGG